MLNAAAAWGVQGRHLGMGRPSAARDAAIGRDVEIDPTGRQRVGAFVGSRSRTKRPADDPGPADKLRRPTSSDPSPSASPFATDGVVRQGGGVPPDREFRGVRDDAVHLFEPQLLAHRVHEGSRFWNAKRRRRVLARDGRSSSRPNVAGLVLHGPQGRRVRHAGGRTAQPGYREERRVLTPLPGPRREPRGVPGRRTRPWLFQRLRDGPSGRTVEYTAYGS